MSETAAAQFRAAPFSEALDAAPDGITIFDGDWTICYANPAAAALWRRPVAELVDRNIWVALPELAGTAFHSFLLHARTVGAPVAWSGFYPPADRWLSVTATVVDDLLWIYLSPPRAQAARPTAIADSVLMAAPDGDSGRLRFLAEVSEALIGTLDTGETAATLADLVVPRLADWSIVTVVGDDDQVRQEAHAHRDPSRAADLETYLVGRLRGTGDGSAMTDALLSGQPVHLAAIDQSLIAASLATVEVREAWTRLDATSFTIVPLRARGETFGVLTLINSGTRPPHTEMEIATAVEVARRGALALDNTRLYGRQLKVAEILQRSLLTPPPQPDHVQIAVRYRPAAAHQYIGGDWYDAFLQTDGATALVIGDVVGHDINAAAAMGQIRSILRGLASDHPGSPAHTLTRADRVLTNLQVGTLATALVARIEQTCSQARTGARTVRWSSAGHLPPILRSPGHRAQLLHSPPEPLLGVGTGRARSDHDIAVHPGDTVVFYTDGLIEHGRCSIDEGLTRLTEAINGLPDLPPDELTDQLLSLIVNGRNDDDIAILTVRFHGKNPVE